MGSDDSADVTGRIYEQLANHFSRARVFRDIDDIPIGMDFRQSIEAGIGRCDVLLVVIGPGWLTATDESGHRRLDDPADFVRLEIEAGLRREIPVVPLTLARSRMPRVDELPESLGPLALRNGRPIRPDPDFHTDMGRLIASLREMSSAGQIASPRHQQTSLTDRPRSTLRETPRAV